MNEQTTGSSWAHHLRSAVLSGYEPAPLGLFTRKSYYPWIVVCTTCIGAFMGQLDASIVQLALPTLEHDFGARLSTVSWVAIAYQLAFTSTLPIYARLAEITGRKLMYIVGFALFLLASLLCGFATSLPALIAFRALLGFSGAMLGANSVIILVKAVGPARQGHAMGIVSAAQAIGVSLGPVTGGVLLGALGWHWVFWITAPFAFAAMVLAWLVIPQTTDFDTDRRFDWRGAVVLMPALTAVLLLISESFSWGVTSPGILTCAIAAVVLIAVFVWRESRTPAPLLDLELFSNPAFAGGIVAIVLSYALLYGMFFLMSFALVRGYHDTPLAAGFRLAIIPVTLGIVAPFSGLLQERFGVRTVLLGGMMICIAAMILLSATLTGTASSLVGVMSALGLFGAGLGMFIAPNNSSTLSAAPGNRRGEAGGLLNLTRVFGTSLGVACASATLSWRLAAATGQGDSTLNVPEQALLGGVTDGLLLLIAFAVVAGFTSVLREPPHASAVKAA